MLLWDLIFYYLDNFFTIFKKFQQAQQFGKIFDNVCVDFSIGVNGKKKQLRCIVDFLGLKFDIIQIEAQLLGDKLKITNKKMVKILEKKSSTSHKKL